MTLWTAIDFATQAHAGQVDQAVAVLHDVLEDTEATAATLPFEATVVEAVVALTTLPHETLRRLPRASDG